MRSALEKFHNPFYHKVEANGQAQKSEYERPCILLPSSIFIQLESRIGKEQYGDQHLKSDTREGDDELEATFLLIRLFHGVQVALLSTLSCIAYRELNPMNTRYMIRKSIPKGNTSCFSLLRATRIKIMKEDTNLRMMVNM
jgi:hypothetical protein